jgi:hypothetical protein
MTSIPETLIIGINTHGCYDVNSDNMIDKFIIPKNTNIIKIDATCLGIDNMMTLETSEHINRKIDEYVESIDDFSDYNMIITNINKIAKKLARKYGKRIKYDYFRKGNKILANYIHHKDKSFLTKMHYEGSPILNKRFVTFDETQIKNYEIVLDDTDYFNQIVIYNMDSTDIMELVYKHFNRNDVYLQELTELLVGMGAKTLIFVDLSCNTFLPTDLNTVLSARDIRTLRRDLERDNIL